MRILFVLLFTAITVLELSATAGQNKPVRVGACISRAGDLAVQGTMYAQGLQLWAQQVNARGGILGQPVELLLKDEPDDPSKMAQAYADLCGPEMASLILGPQNTALSLACLPMLQQAGMPGVFPMASSDVLWEQSRGLAFGVQSTLSAWSLGFFEVAARSGIHSLALIAVDHPEGGNILKPALRWAKRYGVDLPFQASVHQKELPAAMAQAQASGAEGLMVWCPSRTCRDTLLTIKRLPWKPKAIFAASEQGSPEFLAAMGKDAEGVFTAAPWTRRTASAFPGGAQFVESFRKEFAREPNHYAAAAFAGGQILEAAADKACSLDREALRQALVGLNVMTIIGRYSVARSGMQLRQFPLTLQWNRGKNEIVWPEEMRTAKPVTGS